MLKHFKKIGKTEKISEWNSKGLSDEVIKPLTAPANSLAPTLKYTGKRICVKSNGGYFKQDEVTFNHGRIVNISIVYDLKSTLNTFNLTFGSSLLGSIKLTKNAYTEKHKYSGYGIRLNATGTFSFSDGSYAHHVISLGLI